MRNVTGLNRSLIDRGKKRQFFHPEFQTCNLNKFPSLYYTVRPSFLVIKQLYIFSRSETLFNYLLTNCDYPHLIFNHLLETVL